MAITLDTLEYARRLRQAGFTEQQAEGQAYALAAIMTESLATRQDIHGLEKSLGELEGRVAIRFEELEKRMTLRFQELEERIALRFAEQTARFDGRLDSRLADLERRVTLRLGAITVAGIGVVSALVKVL